MDAIRAMPDTNTNLVMQTHSWDEWAHVTRLLKFNQTNIALQKALQSQYKAAQAASASSSKAAKATAAKDRSAVDRGLGRKDGARSTKRGREEVSRPVCIEGMIVVIRMRALRCRTRGRGSQR